MRKALQCLSLPDRKLLRQVRVDFMTGLIIVGASGHGKVVADIAWKMGKWSKIAFLDDDENIKSTLGMELIGRSSDASKYKDDYELFVGIGNNSVREKIQSRLEAVGAKIPVLVHPQAVVGLEVEIGAGTAVMAGAVINCCTKIGKGCIINTGATVDHDNTIGDYAHISPGAHLAGKVEIGKGTWMGIASAVSNNISIAGGCRIGAGAIVIKEISEVGTYIGVPAKKTSR